jgi:hypothetical protein
VPLIPNPIRKVLSSMQTHRVRALLMGEQACVFYGAAEFSRDTDLAVLADAANLVRLRAALAELKAEPIAVPPCTLAFLKRGHGSHFRCHHPEAMRMRVDVMAKMRGVDPFASLWRRRTSIELPDGTPCDLLSLADLVQAKKTQRDKDWPMIRRLVEAHFFERSSIADGRAGAILVPRIANVRVAGGTRRTVSGRLCSRGATPSIVDRSQGGRCQ